MRLIPCRFELAGLGSYPGFQAEDGRPLFSHDVSMRIAGDWQHLPCQPGETPRQAAYDDTRDRFRFYDPATDEWLFWSGERHGEAVLYPIGDGAWTFRN
jgi:hypothetical protein